MTATGTAQLIVGLADVRAAALRLTGVAHCTPVITSEALDAEAGGARVLLKCENLQRGGAFKFRGAYNRLTQLSPEQRLRGVVAFSSGNHAQGVALAARELGIPATVVMPRDAPPIKLAATRSYGATVVEYEREREDREAIARALADERGLTLVPPYDDPLIIAGQGTVGLEMVEQAGDPLDLVIVPLGGGGLLAGVAIAVKGLSPSTELIGVETETADDWVQSLAAGHRIKIAPPSTVADGMRTLSPGELTFPIVRRLVRSVETVSDAEVIDAVRFLLLRTKLLVEPTGAVGVALLRARRLGNLRGMRVGVVLSGGNIEPTLLAEALRSSQSAR